MLKPICFKEFIEASEKLLNLFREVTEAYSLPFKQPVEPFPNNASKLPPRDTLGSAN